MSARYRLRVVLSATLTLALAFACAAIGPRRADAQTPTPRAAAIPARIVSTSPSITETLFALGLGEHVVGVSTFCRHPAAVASLPKVGTFLKPSAEIIASLKPDLVYLHAGSSSASGQLRALGIRTASVERGSLANLYATIRGIGAAGGVPDRADRLVSDLTASLARVKTAVAGRAPRKVLIIVGRRTGTLSDMVAVGPGTYLHDLATLAGGTNVLAASTVEYPRISMETVISLAPDVIIDVGEMGESPADVAKRQRVTEGLWSRQSLVKAAQSGGVRAVNDDAFVTPGPRIAEVARAMALWLHGVKVS